MSHNTPGSPANIVPAFKYQDARKACAWLEKVFGFQRQLEVPAPDGTVAHAELSLGPGVIMLGSVQRDPDNPWAEEKFGVYVRVYDLDAHYARAKAAGAHIVRELQDTPYGSREYSARDVEGFLWSFGTYCPHSGDAGGKTN
jgi:uncharacterized glyoxalase superfamily protein PhnB